MWHNHIVCRHQATNIAIVISASAIIHPGWSCGGCRPCQLRPSFPSLNGLSWRRGCGSAEAAPTRPASRCGGLQCHARRHAIDHAKGHAIEHAEGHAIHHAKGHAKKHASEHAFCRGFVFRFAVYSTMLSH
jgi:hypothetical protein